MERIRNRIESIRHDMSLRFGPSHQEYINNIRIKGYARLADELNRPKSSNNKGKLEDLILFLNKLGV